VSFVPAKTLLRLAEPWLQAGKQVSGLPGRRGWVIAEHAGDRAPDRRQRLLNRAVRDSIATVAVVRGLAVVGLDEAARDPAAGVAW
jgi:hypothetical protein